MEPPIRLFEGVLLPRAAVRLTAVRAGGPGGQNVNKVASKVDLRIDLAAIVGLSTGARARLLAAAAPRLDGHGLLQLVSQKTRDRARNIEDALDRLRVLVRAALVEPKRRRATRPSRGAVERRLRDKHERAGKKRDRSTRCD